MSKQQQSSKATTVSAIQSLRAKRVDFVQATLYARHVAAKQQAYLAKEQLAKQLAYKSQLAALQQEYGIVATVLPGNTVRAPKGSGVCAQVHAIAAQHNYVRSATLAACAVAGINKATAATQFAIAAKMHKAA